MERNSETRWRQIRRDPAWRVHGSTNKLCQIVTMKMSNRKEKARLRAVRRLRLLLRRRFRITKRGRVTKATSEAKSLSCDEIRAHVLMLLDHSGDSLERPVNFLAADDERRGDANHAIMSFLAQNSFFFQSFAVGACRAVKFDADPQALAANFF